MLIQWNGGAYAGLLVESVGAHAEVEHRPVTLPELLHGWGIPSATDISLAWMVASRCFPRGHAATNFLLLLAGFELWAG